MSSWADKQNEKGRLFHDDRARASAESLERKRGFRRVSADRIEIDSMGILYVWLRVAGNGKKALYALQK